MIGEPPLKTPKFHDKPITDEFVIRGTFTNRRGGSGLVRIMDPKLKLDTPESLTMLVA